MFKMPDAYAYLLYSKTAFVSFIRLLMTGSLDEKMYQRQVKKQGLSGAVVDARSSDRVHFSTEELKVSSAVQYYIHTVHNPFSPVDLLIICAVG